MRMQVVTFGDAPQLGGFNGAWEDWCDQNYWTPENNEKCKNCNIVKIPIVGPKCTYPDPKTVVGRTIRGLPQQTDLERLGPPGGTEIPTPVPIPETSDAGGGSWFEQNKMLVFGGGIVALGALAFLMSRRGGRRMNGFAGFLGFRHPKRRKKRS